MSKLSKASNFASKDPQNTNIVKNNLLMPKIKIMQ
jgi:hypothetical protein